MSESIGGVFRWLMALIPVAWIGYLLWHFAGVGGNTAKGIVGIGLGPTVLGLSIIALLFLIGPLVKLIRVVSGSNRIPGSGVKVGDDLPMADSFDADAAFANYMRNRDSAPSPTDSDFDEDLPPIRPRPGGFGRKSV